MQYKNLTIVEYVNQFFDTKREHTLVDVRTSSEYTGGHIPDAINIPLAELQQRLHEIPHNHQVVVVCASGSRSISGSEVLGRAGFSDVFNLKGGTMTWMMGMRPIVR